MCIFHDTRYRSYLKGEETHGAYPNALGKAIVMGVGTLVITEIIVIETRLRHSMDPDAASTTQTVIKVRTPSYVHTCVTLSCCC
jgi:hypothetical protein